MEQYIPATRNGSKLRVGPGVYFQPWLRLEKDKLACPEPRMVSLPRSSSCIDGKVVNKRPGPKCKGTKYCFRSAYGTQNAVRTGEGPIHMSTSGVDPTHSYCFVTIFEYT